MNIDGQGITPVGVLLVERDVSPNVDRSVGRFRYAPSYLKRPSAVPLDPVHLPLQEGEFRFARMGGLPGAMRDAGPDNWGRMLIERVLTARGHSGPIAEVEYLLHAPADRSGNLHFATDFGTDGTPRWDQNALRPHALREMAQLKEHVLAVLRAAKGAPGKPYPPQVDELLTGSGGARPKVNITARNGLHLVKLANPQADKLSNARLERASLRMAESVGIPVAQAALKEDGEQGLLALKRFDTADGGRRLQMVSAMTVLGASDEAFNRRNWSYPQLARELDRWSADPAADKEILFRCMVLRAMLSDADDHPRNYALVRDPLAGDNGRGGSTFGQWRLAPFYDCVATMGRGHKASELAMSIGDFGYQITEENILSDCAAFGLSQDRAAVIMRQIEQRVLHEFPKLMAECGLSPQDMGVVMAGVVALDDRRADSAIERLMLQGRAQDQAPVAHRPRG